jgi:hypothetical protein
VKIAPLLAAGKYSLLRLTRALRALGLVLLFAAGTAGIALAVVFPLWFFATRHTGATPSSPCWLCSRPCSPAAAGRCFVRRGSREASRPPCAGSWFPPW